MAESRRDQGDARSATRGVLRSSFIAIVVFVVSCPFIWLLVVGLGDQWIPQLLGYSWYQRLCNPLPVGTIICIAAGWFAWFAFQCARNAVGVRFLRASSIVYVVLALAIVMLKSRGVRGFNINPLNLITQLSASPSIVLLNIMVYIPVGMMLYGMHNAKRAWISIVIIICGMELLQYVFALGIFDIVDISMNLIGFSIGYLCMDELFRKYHWEQVGGQYRIVRISHTAQNDSQAR
ncbi:VanZ family protein [Bifidobacterium apri]|uniref:VanZ-like protein n=1 Tax=Bifidobacterium apri TaxID=1769423 RepID=A0A6A2V9E0_9BIFI|nr:VanZ family protein [Bifidobacterium apri]KAB8299600.1 VanZ-like protein [Bifidobacterium apri]